MSINKIDTNEDGEEVELFPTLVYGTLLTGEGNWNWALSPAEGIPTKIKGTIRSLGGFPGYHLEGDEEIYAELFWVDAQTLASLDRLEGQPRMYRREVIETLNEEQGWVYVYQSPMNMEDTVINHNWLDEVNTRRGPRQWKTR